MKHKGHHSPRPQHAPAVYVTLSDELDELGLFEVMKVDAANCPTRGWFRARAALNGFSIVQHKADGVHLVLRVR